MCCRASRSFADLFGTGLPAGSYRDQHGLRTVYRDIADLVGQRVPICGGAGVGYVLEAGLDLPPLMLTQDEIEAAVLGAQWVARHSDPILARAAEDLIAKIGAVVPERLRPYVLEPVTETREPGSALPIFGVGFCYACSAVGHPPIAPASKARKSQRLITQPRPGPEMTWGGKYGSTELLSKAR